jgi:hypothetical protein
MFLFERAFCRMSRKGVRKPIKVISGQLWKSKRKQELSKSDSLEIRRRRAKLLVKQLRRAAKKGKVTAVSHCRCPLASKTTRSGFFSRNFFSYQVRKAIRNLAAARESGKGDEKIESLEKIFLSLKNLNLDSVVNNALAEIPNIDATISKGGDMNAESSEPIRMAIGMIMRTSVVQEQLKALTALFNGDPSEIKGTPKGGLKKTDSGSKMSKQPKIVENSRLSVVAPDSASDGSFDSEEVADSEPDSDGSVNDEPARPPHAEKKKPLMKKRPTQDDSLSESDAEDSLRHSMRDKPNQRKNSRQVDEDESDSEPEDVSALIGEKPSKNRPGQRTRRKMILQKFGRNALVFQKERERKRGQQAQSQPAAAKVDPSTLHPSWAAKQRVKAAMSAAIAAAPKRIRLDAEESAGGRAARGDARPKAPKAAAANAQGGARPLLPSRGHAALP